jgi:hypothetical protein
MSRPNPHLGASGPRRASRGNWPKPNLQTRRWHAKMVLEEGIKEIDLIEERIKQTEEIFKNTCITYSNPIVTLVFL